MREGEELLRGHTTYGPLRIEWCRFVSSEIGDVSVLRDWPAITSPEDFHLNAINVIGDHPARRGSCVYPSEPSIPFRPSDVSEELNNIS